MNLDEWLTPDLEAEIMGFINRLPDEQKGAAARVFAYQSVRRLDDIGLSVDAVMQRYIPLLAAGNSPEYAWALAVLSLQEAPAP